MDSISDFTTTLPDTTDGTVTMDTPVTKGDPGPGVGVYIIFAGGGALLIALFTLIICIFKSHRKTHRNTNSVRRVAANARAHGGINPSFTPYDEIWTWIPVVRDTQANCQSQINPSARVQSPNREQALLSTLTLPTYSEAVSSTTNNARTSVANARSQTQSSNTASVPNRRQHTRTNNGATNQASQRNTDGPSSSTQGNANEHVYETLPVRTRTRASNFQTPPSYVTSVSVTNSSGASISSAITHAQSAAHAQDNPELRTNASNVEGAAIDNVHNNNNNRNAGNSRNHRTTTNQNGATRRVEDFLRQGRGLHNENGVPTQQRRQAGNNPPGDVQQSSYTGSNPSGDVQQASYTGSNPSGDVQQSSYVLYPRYHRQEPWHQPEFSHSARSMFSCIATPDRLIRSDIPPRQSSRDAPPAYTSHAPTYSQAPPTRQTATSYPGRQSDMHPPSRSRSPTAPNLSLEYTYF